MPCANLQCYAYGLLSGRFSRRCAAGHHLLLSLKLKSSRTQRLRSEFPRRAALFAKAVFHKVSVTGGTATSYNWSMAIPVPRLNPTQPGITMCRGRCIRLLDLCRGECEEYGLQDTTEHLVFGNHAASTSLPIHRKPSATVPWMPPKVVPLFVTGMEKRFFYTM